MCGIVGLADLRGGTVHRGALASALAALAHRGPDGEGVWAGDGVCLAHRRLAIIDPQTGQQPLVDAAREVAVTYNGEIYNYVELREQLRARRPFLTSSDTEVLARAYEAWGIDCVERFRGMYAFGLFDARKRLLYLARDRLGIKPLYYTLAEGRLAFASELGALLRLEGVAREIDHTALVLYFRYGYVPEPLTIYRNVFKLPPGCWLCADTGSGAVRLHRYWDLAVRVREQAEAPALQELNRLLDDTIRIYVRSDVPFGSFLSGGVDSSLVSALMGRSLSTPVESFSIGFREASHSELQYAEDASRVVGTSHHATIVEAEEPSEILPRIAAHFGEPFADSSAIPTYYVAREARRHVKMVLSGDGGDELFAGYDSYPRALRSMRDPLLRLKRALWRVVARSAPVEAVRRRAARLGMSLREEHDAHRFVFDDRTLQGLLISPPPEIPGRGSVDAQRQAPDAVTVFQAEDVRSYLPGDILTKVDRMSMANSLEVRVPLLDHEIVEFAFSLPLALKLRGPDPQGRIQTKYLLKRSAGRFFTDQFLSRPKWGFGVPLGDWCVGPWRHFLLERLGNSGSGLYDFIRYDRVSRLLSPLKAGQNTTVTSLWPLLMFDLWFDCVHRESPR